MALLCKEVVIRLLLPPLLHHVRGHYPPFANGVGRRTMESQSRTQAQAVWWWINA